MGQVWSGLGGGGGEAWWGSSAVGRAAGLAGLSLLRWLDHDRWRLSSLAFHARCLRLASTAQARLDALRRLGDCLRPSEPSETGLPLELASPSDFPDDLVGSLFHGLVESGREVAGPLLRLLHSPYFDVSQTEFGRMSLAAREELFAEASLARLRAFFLRSEDPVVQKAFFRLLHLATKNLWWLKTRFDGGGPDGGLGCPDVPLIRAQFDRLQRLLWDPDFLAKVRESVWAGGELWALEEACDAYAELACPGAFRDYEEDYGIQFVLRPLLPRLARRWDELPGSVKELLSGLRVLLAKGEGPQVEAELVGGCVVPLLQDATRIPLDCLRWLFDQAAFNFWRGLLGCGLRDSVMRALTTAVERVGLDADKAWLLLQSVCEPADMQDPELRLFIVETWWRLPLNLDSRETAARILRQLLAVRGVEAAGGWAVGRGAFAMAERLLRLNLPPFHLRNSDYGGYICHLHLVLRSLPKLLQPSLAWPPGPPLGPREETERLMAWREQGLGPALRALLLHEPPPHTTDLRPGAQALLDLADGLLRHQPGIPAFSNLPTEIRFPPDWEW